MQNALIAIAFAGAIALTMGALVAGSEYGWATLKTILTQRPGRRSVLAGKLLAIVTAILVVVVGVFALNALWSWVIAATEDRPADWPSALELAKGIGAGWLVLGTWSLVGAVLGMEAIGVGDLEHDPAMALHQCTELLLPGGVACHGCGVVPHSDA